MFRPLLGSVLLFAAANLVSNVSAAVLYDEATAGDFSGSGLTPTSVGLLAPGSNQIFGSTGNVGGSDRDYFTLTVPNGYQLASILELPGTQSGNLSFIGLQEGPQVTLPTVDRGLRLVVFCSIEMDGLSPSMASTSGRSIWSRNCRA